MHFAVFVVGKGILLQSVDDDVVRDDDVVAVGCLHDKFEDVEQFPCVPSTVA